MLALLILLLSEGTGKAALYMMKIHQDGYAAPIGFAVLLCVLEIGFIPAQLAELPFMWNIIVTALVMMAAAGLTIWQFRDTIRQWICWRSLIVVGYAAFFLVTLIVRTGSASTIVPVPSGNAIRFQSYYAFANVLAYFMGRLQMVSEVDSVQVLAMEEILYHALMAMLIVNIVFHFRLRNQWLTFCIAVSLLFSGTFSTVFADSGERYRLFFVTLAVFTMYLYLKEGNEQVKYLLLYTVGAGMACSPSFLFLSIEMIYCFAVYLFSLRKIRSLFDLFTFLIPSVIYAFLYLCPKHPGLAWIILLLYAWFLVIRYHARPRRAIARSEEFCFDHVILIFYLIVPCALALLSLVLRLTLPAGTVSYLTYLKAFPLTDIVTDQLFLHSDLLGILATAIRWAGVAVVIAFAKTKEDRMIRALMILMLTIFLNPLCTIAISQILTGSLCYRGFDILFNPMTVMLILAYLYHFLEWQVFWQWVLELFLLINAGMTIYLILF